MDQDIPSEEYMPGGSSQPTSPDTQDPYPAALKTSSAARDSSCPTHSDTVSSCPNSPSSSASISEPPHSPQEISPLEQEVIDLYKMARLDDESGFESERGDEFDGGAVSLAVYEDPMDADVEVGLGQGSWPTSGITPPTL